MTQKMMVKNQQTIRSNPHKRVIKREHYCRKDGQWKPKFKFASEEAAQCECKRMKINGYRTYHPYICKVCGYWHIGMKKIDPRECETL